MVPSFEEYIKSIPGIAIHVDGPCVSVTLMGYDETIKLTRYFPQATYMGRAWRDFREEDIDPFLQGKLLHPYSNWFRHMLLCYVGRANESLEELRKVALINFNNSTDGLTENCWIPVEAGEDGNPIPSEALPPEKREVLLQVKSTSIGIPDKVCVGYLKLAAGDPLSPQFIIPGNGGIVKSWCDFIQPNFKWPSNMDNS